MKIQNQRKLCLINCIKAVSITNLNNSTLFTNNKDTTIYVLNLKYTFCKSNNNEYYTSNKLSVIVDDKNRTITIMNGNVKDSSVVIGFVNLNGYVYKYENNDFVVYSKITKVNKIPLKSNEREIFISKRDTLLKSQIDYNYDYVVEIKIQTQFEYTHNDCDYSILTTKIIEQKYKQYDKYKDYKVRDWRNKYE